MAPSWTHNARLRPWPQANQTTHPHWNITTSRQLKRSRYHHRFDCDKQSDVPPKQAQACVNALHGPPTRTLQIIIRPIISLESTTLLYKIEYLDAHLAGGRYAAQLHTAVWDWLYGVRLFAVVASRPPPHSSSKAPRFETVSARYLSVPITSAAISQVSYCRRRCCCSTTQERRDLLMKPHEILGCDYVGRAVGPARGREGLVLEDVIPCH